MAESSDLDRIADVTKRAAEIAALVPDHLQEAAFNRAFDRLIGDEPARPRAGSGNRRVRATKARATTGSSDDLQGRDDPAAVLIDSLSRTDYPEVGQAVRALDRALYILRIASEEYGIDGMSAPQIAKVLTEKFRLRVTRQAIGQALDAAGNYVDRVSGKRGAVYRLMQPGEDYLAAGGTSADHSGTSPRRTSTRRRGQKRAVHKGQKREPSGNAASTSTSTNTPARRRSGRGPKALVEELIDEGFFSEPRSIGDIQDRLRHKKGVQLKPTDLSPALVRLLREDKLDRERNESNQYEYKVPS
jgi:hypothetical protein